MAVGLPVQGLSSVSTDDGEHCHNVDVYGASKSESTWKPPLPVHQKTLSLVLSLHGGRRKFGSSMQPVPEEEHQQKDGRSGDHGSGGSSGDDRGGDTGDSDSDSDSDSAQQELLHPYCTDPTRLAMELEHVKQMHEQDKQFFTNEIRNIRMLLFEAESNLQDRTDELQYILQERETDKWEWEARREQEAEGTRAVREELDAKRRECADVMDVLEEARKELVGVVCNSDSGRVSSLSGCSAGTTMVDARSTAPSPPLASPTSSLARYAWIPSRVASLRKRVLEDEERFQAAYSAWSSENKYLRKQHQTQLKALNDDLRKSREKAQALSAENKKLLTRVESLSLSRKESMSMRPPSPAMDEISVEEALKLVQRLNMRIADASVHLVQGLATERIESDTAAHPAITREAVWLLGGEQLTSQLTFVPSPSRDKDNVALRTLIQVSLTTWSAFHVHSWDLRSNTGGTPNPQPMENPLSAIYRKLKIVEDPSVAGKWRSLTRAQIRLSSAAWTQALISSIFSIFTFLGLTYSHPINSMAQELQPLLAAIRSVREALGELVVSKDLEIATVNPGARFDYTYMKDAAVSGSVGFHSTSQPSRSTTSTRRRPETVVATCGLGLKDSERLFAKPQVLRKASLAEFLPRRSKILPLLLNLLIFKYNQLSSFRAVHRNRITGSGIPHEELELGCVLDIIIRHMEYGIQYSEMVVQDAVPWVPWEPAL